MILFEDILLLMKTGFSCNIHAASKYTIHVSESYLLTFSNDYYSNQLQNFVAYDLNDDRMSTSWSMNTDRENLLHRMRGYSPAILAACQKATDILPMWKCVDREPLEKLYRGKLVLIGDAAHPMYPHLGQGA